MSNEMHAMGDPYGNPYMQAYQQASPYANGNNGNGDYNNMSQQGYDESYMQQEEEWEREGLLDPLWEKQQRKVMHFFFIKNTKYLFYYQALSPPIR
jgi:hypothetical protein